MPEIKAWDRWAGAAIEPIRRLRKHPWQGAAAGFLVVAAAIVLRLVLDRYLTAVPLITVFPAIAVAALFGGLRVGVAAALVALLAGVFLVTPASPDLAITGPRGFLIVFFFLVTCVTILTVIHLLNRSVDRLAEERDRAHALFQELQHRVANNMQFIGSLLYLQGRAVAGSSPEAASALDDAQRRLALMAGVHRRLYDPAAASMASGDYLRELMRDILAASGREDIEVRVEAETARLGFDKLVPLSLIVSEAVTNSLKHAFPAGRKGKIDLALARSPDGWKLTIHDNGEGFPAGFRPQDGNRLGFKITEQLARQMNGQLAYQNEGGASIRLVFPA